MPGVMGPQARKPGRGSLFLDGPLPHGPAAPPGPAPAPTAGQAGDRWAGRLPARISEAVNWDPFHLTDEKSELPGKSALSNLFFSPSCSH